MFWLFFLNKFRNLKKIINKKRRRKHLCDKTQFETATNTDKTSVELKLRTWVFFCGDHALRLRLTSARKLTMAAKTMRRRVLNRGRTEHFCGCGSFMGFAKDRILKD